ncbi:hypothetical protein PO909_032607 [Leuciscus waleckii]
MRVFMRSEQVNLRPAKLSPYKLNHFRVEPQFPGPQPLPRQDVCSHIFNPRNINGSHREKFALGPKKDLMRQSTKRARSQTSLAVDIRDHRHIVCPNENMMASEVYKEVPQGKEYSQHLQTINMQREMMVLPSTSGVTALHNRTPAREGRIRGKSPSLTWCSQNRTLRQEPRFLPHDQRTKTSVRNSDRAKRVSQRRKPLVPEPPLQGPHMKQTKGNYRGSCSHKTQNSLKMFYSDSLA